AEKTVQLSERVEERAVREHAVHRLVDGPEPEGEEHPGEDPCPGEQRAEGKKQTVGLSSNQRRLRPPPFAGSARKHQVEELRAAGDTELGIDLGQMLLD